MRNNGFDIPFFNNAVRHAPAGEKSARPHHGKLHVASNDFFLQLPNIIGGIVLVTTLRLLRTKELVLEERDDGASPTDT